MAYQELLSIPADRNIRFIPQWEKGDGRKWPPNDEAFREWLLGNIEMPHLSGENVFQPGSSMFSSYENFVEGGGLESIGDQEYGQKCLRRLELVMPSDNFYREADFSDDRLPVFQKGRGNKGYLFDEYWGEVMDLKAAEIGLLVQRQDGRGAVTKQVSFKAWFANKPGVIVASKLIVTSRGARTGDMLGGVGSMCSPISSRGIELRVHHDYMPRKYHLAFISLSRCASAMRKLNDIFGR